MAIRLKLLFICVPFAFSWGVSADVSLGDLSGRFGSLHGVTLELTLTENSEELQLSQGGGHSAIRSLNMAQEDGWCFGFDGLDIVLPSNMYVTASIECDIGSAAVLSSDAEIEVWGNTIPVKEIVVDRKKTVVVNGKNIVRPGDFSQHKLFYHEDFGIVAIQMNSSDESTIFYRYFTQ